MWPSTLIRNAANLRTLRFHDYLSYVSRDSLFQVSSLFIIYIKFFFSSLRGGESFKSVRSDWFFLGWGFCSTDRSQAGFGAKPANSKFATKTAKKMWILSFFTAQLAEKAKKIEILQMDEEDEHSLSEFYITLKIWNFWCRNWNRHHRKGGHRRFYQPSGKCKHKQEDGYWFEHSSPLHGS